MRKRYTIFPTLLLLCGAIAYPVLSRTSPDNVKVVEEYVDPQLKISYTALLNRLNDNKDDFRGKTAILVKDLKSRETIDINSDMLFPSASLVKIPIMAALFQAEQEGKINLTDQVVLKRSHKVRSSSKLYYARNGSKFTINRLIEMMITKSDNTATNMLVDVLGFGYINRKFVQFGLRNTDLRRGIMDLRMRNSGIENYTTATDMASLLERIYRGQLVSAKASSEMLEVLKRQEVNDRIPRLLPSSLTIAHKTGLLNGTVSDVGIIFTPEGDYILCVLTDDIRSFISAKRFIGKIAKCTYDICYNKS